MDKIDTHPLKTVCDIRAEMLRLRAMLENAIFSAALCYSTDAAKAKIEILDELYSLIDRPRNCDTMNWRNAWDAWRSKRQIGKPQSAKEAYDLMAQFLDWYTSANYEEGK